jgi:hypothetical protein
MAGRAVPITLRAQALTLLEVNTSIAKIIKQTSLVKSTIHRIEEIAYEHGFDPTKDRIRDDHMRGWPYGELFAKRDHINYIHPSCRGNEVKNTPNSRSGLRMRWMQSIGVR